MKFLKFIWRTVKIILFLALFIFGLIGFWFMVNGGNELFEGAINSNGFINFIKDFFISIYEGIKGIIGG